MHTPTNTTNKLLFTSTTRMHPHAGAMGTRKGRATDNICIERFWRSIKYEEIYLNEYKNVKVLRKSIENYMIKYNSKRLHSTIDYKTPNEVYFEYINNLGFEGEKLLQTGA